MATLVRRTGRSFCQITLHKVKQQQRTELIGLRSIHSQKHCSAFLTQWPQVCSNRTEELRRRLQMTPVPPWLAAPSVTVEEGRQGFKEVAKSRYMRVMPSAYVRVCGGGACLPALQK
jgi:hypothetical protein